ncbi:hypothetical protein DFH09DRAFT_903910 [Mycena vulgaris]|nr:hypothetical protein DFH09DRAFT_903910 [Mycena vulgaris]
MTNRKDACDPNLLAPEPAGHLHPYFIVANQWSEPTSLADINILRKKFRTQQLPIVEQIAGPNAGSYSNEADVFETGVQTTSFGPSYEKLSAIKAKYDAKDFFIVGTGVGSERWDEWGICKVGYS